MMILFDPELNSGALRKAGAARRHGGRIISPENLQLPSSRALAGFLVRAQAAVRLRGQVSVLLTTDRVLRKLNKQFRGKDKATDVLSFPAADLLQNRKSNREKGDLAISVETAQEQSLTRGHTLEMEIRILILHGLLHLSGLDHETDDGEMARRERALRARLGLEKGLIERAESRRRRPAVPSAPAVRRARTTLAQDDNKSRTRNRTLRPRQGSRARGAR